MNLPQKDLNALTREAYLESANLAKANANKYKNYTDPILQQNEYYVRENFYFYFH